jgi:hypothetical protein
VLGNLQKLWIALGNKEQLLKFQSIMFDEARVTGRSSSIMRASLGWKALFRSGATQFIAR